MRSLFAIVAAIIALICALVHKPQFSITDGAAAVFRAYIESHPVAAEHETRCSGIDVTDPARIADYFAIELRERDHADVRDMIRERGGTFDADCMRAWRDENYRENYVLRKRGCDD